MNQQPDERPAPPDDVAIRRFCHRCAKYIEHPPFMVTDCCNSTYHDMCSMTLPDRDLAACPGCKTKPLKFSRDTEFAREVNKYDWSLLEPTPGGAIPGEHDLPAPVQISNSRELAVIGGTMASPQEQAALALPGTIIEPAAHTAALAEVREGLAIEGQLVAAQQNMEQLATQLGNLLQTQMVLHPRHPDTPSDAQPPPRPSERLNVSKITKAFERMLVEIRSPADLEALKGQRGYNSSYAPC
ncbi:hypothetical protein [Endozoicomonas sp. SCSIO W0465]|uniref:hypothetical protein n=1 Tax=Endozoicomonas sp. SCSIO W0465 TaxID=2918516 RepID=UPI002075E3F7|nr:hypothetical protein [Endozoicomonas sp. SCSIO W0465]USE35434.1 hypothetical protein MJO57_25585 [Endozoicomonas sp. SCSIO W0465]